MSREQVRLYIGTPHSCGYLPERLACSVFVDPKLTLSSGRYGALLDLGFRRSGRYVYRPACDGCRSCMPVRVLTADFRPTRNQKRCLARNADITLNVEPHLTDQHYELYRRYLQARHADAGMDPDDRHAFHQFLESAWGETQVWTFAARGKLVAVAIVDAVPRGLSAVYTFFDPGEPRRSLGTYAILRQIEIARALKLPYLYLGYWVPGSEKMDYKKSFRPQEIHDGRLWRRIEAAEAFPDNGAPQQS
jgi:leucyl-tRNA---protein transferase